MIFDTAGFFLFFTYTVKNFAYLAHDMEELNRKKMIVFIPFQSVDTINRVYRYIGAAMLSGRSRL